MKKYWFVFCKSDLMLQKNSDGTYTIPYSEEAPVEIKTWTKIHNITPFDDGTEVKTLKIDAPVSDNIHYEMVGLRPSFFKIDRALYDKAAKCFEILYWDSITKYCAICGAPMAMHTDISKKCTNCGHEIWPQLSIAVIVLIHKKDDVLLVHAKNFRGDFYGLVAGFVETGETLEQAVRREVMEETSLKIKNLKYFGSRPWPYPCGLMAGFYAEYESGEIKLQRSELSAGGWYHYDALPQIPDKVSIARKLIDNWIAKGCNP